MSLVLAQSVSAQRAYELVTHLQAFFVSRLDALTPPSSSGSRFVAIDWLRAGGRYGGGNRYTAKDGSLFNRASVNVSQVQYEADPTKKLNSATAISTIIHPLNPLAPSMHMHISWTEMKSGDGYWRLMADLNPSVTSKTDAEIFDETLKRVAGGLYLQGKEQGERYFYIPALERHRGVSHFYLEDYKSGDEATDLAFAKRFGEEVIGCYARILQSVLTAAQAVEEQHRKQQLDYHTLYFLQVLTLDRGTTSGLLVHDENDTGILGSLPSAIDKELLRQWLPKLPALQAELLRRLIAILPESTAIDDKVKGEIAKVARDFYREFPAAQDLLARGDVIPPTQENHRS